MAGTALNFTDKPQTLKRPSWKYAILFLFAAILLSDSGGSGPYGNLITEGIPPTPATLRARARPYSPRGAVLLDWHPRWLEMLIRTRFDRAGHIQEIFRPLGKRYRLTSAGPTAACGASRRASSRSRS